MNNQPTNAEHDDGKGSDAVRFVDERLGASPLLKTAMRYLFPDHWTFLVGEIALYSFVVLIATGTYLALFFDPSTSTTVYHGAFAPLAGQTVSRAFASTVAISYEVPAGLLIRQTHHWAALVFVAAIVVHLMRIFFTGAFRKPRDVNWMIGLTLLVLAILEGFAGYSLPDDLLSGMGLAIGYGVALSVPLVGANLAFLIWGGQFPGSSSFEPRLFIAHVFLFPAILATLIGAHLAIIMRQKHSSSPAPEHARRTSSARRCGPATRYAPPASCSPWPGCCSCSAASYRSTPYGNTGRLSHGSAPTARNPTGTSAG